MQAVNLLDDPRERRTTPCMVSYRGEDAPEPFPKCIVAQVLQLVPEFAVNELEHLFGFVQKFGPTRPAELIFQTPSERATVERRFLLAPRFRFVECLQEKHPGKLF